MFMSLAGKDIAVQVTGDAPPIQVVLEHTGAGFRNYDPPNLVSFSGEGQPCQILLELHIPHTQITNFLRPRSAGVHQIQNHLVPPPNVGRGIREPEQESDFLHRKYRPGLGLGAFGGDFLYAVHKNRGGVKIPVLCVCGERGQDRQSLVTGRNGAFSGLLKPIHKPGQRVIVQLRKGNLMGLYALFLLKIGQQQPECIFVRPDRVAAQSGSIGHILGNIGLQYVQKTVLFTSHRPPPETRWRHSPVDVSFPKRCTEIWENGGFKLRKTYSLSLEARSCSR